MSDPVAWLGVFIGAGSLGVSIWNRVSMNQQWNKGPIRDRQAQLRQDVLVDLRNTLQVVEQSLDAAKKRDPLDVGPDAHTRTASWWMTKRHLFLSDKIPEILQSFAGVVVDWGSQAIDYGHAQRAVAWEEDRDPGATSARLVKLLDLQGAAANRLETAAAALAPQLKAAIKKIEVMDNQA